MREVYPDVNAIAPAPKGETVYKASRSTASPEAPRFDVTLAERDGTIVLTIGYGTASCPSRSSAEDRFVSDALACRARTAGLAGLHPLGHLMEGLVNRVRAVLPGVCSRPGCWPAPPLPLPRPTRPRRKWPRARPGRRRRRSSRARSSTGAASGATGSGTATARPGRRRSSCPVLDLSTEAGGLTPLRQVGGFQTEGLAMKGADGRGYTFRKLEKHPERVLPKEWQDSELRAIAIDQTAAAHPAATAIVGSLARSVGIRFYGSRLAVMPDDPALGEFRETFGGTVGTLRRVHHARLRGHHRDRVLLRPVEEVARGRPREPRRQPRVPEGAPLRPRGRELGPPPGPVALGARPGPARCGSRCPRTPTRRSRATRARRWARCAAWCRASCATRASTRSGSRG